METEQNIQNVQRTNLRNIHEKFEQLSVVTEETSAENSEHSVHKFPSPDGIWNNIQSDVLSPDESYPEYTNMDNAKKYSLNDKTHYVLETDSLNHFGINNQIRNEMVYPEYFNNVQFPNTTADVKNINPEGQIG